MHQHGTEIWLTGVAESQDPLLSVKVTRELGGFLAEVLIVHRGKKVRCCGSIWKASLTELRDAMFAYLMTFNKRHSKAWREGVLADIAKIEKRYEGKVFDQMSKRYVKLPKRAA